MHHRRVRSAPFGSAPMTQRARHSWLIAPLLVVVLGATSVGCMVRILSEYDEVTDQSATALQKKVEAFVIKMMAVSGTPAGEYARNADFYDEALIDARSIKMRASLIPKNDLTVQHAQAIEQNIENLRNLHRLGGGSGLRPAVAVPALSALNQQFEAVIRLEIAKRRGKG
jgi:hypothetical protein